VPSRFTIGPARDPLCWILSRFLLQRNAFIADVRLERTHLAWLAFCQCHKKAVFNVQKDR